MKSSPEATILCGVPIFAGVLPPDGRNDNNRWLSAVLELLQLHSLPQVVIVTCRIPKQMGSGRGVCRSRHDAWTLIAFHGNEPFQPPRRLANRTSPQHCKHLCGNCGAYSLRLECPGRQYGWVTGASEMPMMKLKKRGGNLTQSMI